MNETWSIFWDGLFIYVFFWWSGYITTDKHIERVGTVLCVQKWFNLSIKNTFTCLRNVCLSIKNTFMTHAMTWRINAIVPGKWSTLVALNHSVRSLAFSSLPINRWVCISPPCNTRIPWVWLRVSCATWMAKTELNNIS